MPRSTPGAARSRHTSVVESRLRLSAVCARPRPVHDAVMADGDRIDASATFVTYDGPPYVDPLEDRIGTLAEQCADLTLAELIELCRYWDWRGSHATSTLERWWCSRFVNLGQRLLVEQGLSREGWRPRA
jgi:hypothetical protein